MVTRDYRGDLLDIWSCGVVLFVLLAGNTPWDEPSNLSYEFIQYKKHKGRVQDELWSHLPHDVLCKAVCISLHHLCSVG